MMRKFGRDMADMAGRAMKGRTDDKMGRAMMAPPRPVRGGVATYKKGGDVKESKAMMKKEVAFMKKKGAPKSMIRHEEKEYGMKKGVKKMAAGGEPVPLPFPLPVLPFNPKFREDRAEARESRGPRMRKGGSVGGSYRKAADGVASKGKTKGKMVKMAYGGKC